MDAHHDDPARLHARRNPDWTFQGVCKYLVWHGRTRLVNDTLQARLCDLDWSEWHFERDFSIGAVPIPFMLFGPTGVFLLQASRGYWTNRDVTDMCRAADTLRAALKGYPDPVHAGIVMLDETELPRQCFACGGEGPCWTLGEGVLEEWLRSFRDRGLSREDVVFLRAWGSAARSFEPRRVFVPANVPDGLS